MLTPRTNVQVQSYIREKLAQPAMTTLPELVAHSDDLRQLVALGVNLREVEKYKGAIDVITTHPLHHMQGPWSSHRYATGLHT